MSQETARPLSRQTAQQIAQALLEAVRTEREAVPAQGDGETAQVDGARQGARRRAGRGCLERLGAPQETGPRGCPYARAPWPTVRGPGTVTRAASVCPAGQATSKPLDEQLGFTADRISPLLRSLVSLSCAGGPCADAGRRRAKATGVHLGAKRAHLVREKLGAQGERVQAPEDSDQLPRFGPKGAGP